MTKAEREKGEVKREKKKSPVMRLVLFSRNI
jgi:hypothetical protein